MLEYAPIATGFVGGQAACTASTRFMTMPENPDKGTAPRGGLARRLGHLARRGRYGGIIGAGIFINPYLVLSAYTLRR